MFVQWQGNLWRHVDEALTQQQPHRLAGVIEDLLQLFRHTVRGVLLTLIHNKLLHLLHTLHTLPTTDTHTQNDDILNELAARVLILSQPPVSRLISKGDGRQWCYLPLCEIEHSDEAKHFIGVVVITVFWHLSLLKHSEGMSEYMLRAETAKNKKSPVRTEMSLNH